MVFLLAGCISENMAKETQDDSIIIEEENNMGNNTESDVEYKSSKIDLPNRVAVMQTNQGVMELELYEKRAPITTKNFIDLAQKGFYDNLTFHRVIKDFMIQGGDPEGDGMGGPGYNIADEFHPELKHDTLGILSMANAGPNTGGSQFFITLIPTPHLDNRHAVFGKVIKGEDVLKKIGAVDTDRMDKPINSVIIEKVTIKNADE